MRLTGFSRWISLGRAFARRVGHPARFSTSRISERANSEIDEVRARLAGVRARAVAEILGASATALSSRDDRGVVVFGGWGELGDWAALNCGRCIRCGVRGYGVGRGVPCAFLPRILGRFIVDGRLPLATFVAIGGVVRGAGYELVGVPPVQCSYIIRVFGPGQRGGNSNDAA